MAGGCWRWEGPSGGGKRLFDAVDKVARRPVRVSVRHMFHALFERFRLVPEPTTEGRRGGGGGREAWEQRRKKERRTDICVTALVGCMTLSINPRFAA
jgi:hypothetical protein